MKSRMQENQSRAKRSAKFKTTMISTDIKHHVTLIVVSTLAFQIGLCNSRSSTQITSWLTTSSIAMSYKQRTSIVVDDMDIKDMMAILYDYMDVGLISILSMN